MTKVRASRGLQQLLEEDPGGYLLYAIEQVQGQAHYRRLGRVLRRLQRRKHEVGWLHVTDMHNPCDRAVAAMLLNYELPRKALSPQQERIFENGTYMHLRYYNYFLSLPPPFNVEVAVVYRQWPLVGEADVVVNHSNFGSLPLIVELKSINDGEFKMLKSPKADHTRQLNGYLGLAVSPLGLVWYESKDTQAVKSFPVPLDKESYSGAIQRALGLVDTILEGKLPAPCDNECEIDKYVGNLQGVEGRIEQLRVVKERWQN